MRLAEWPRFAVELAFAVRSQWKSPAALAERQSRDLMEQLHVASDVPFYQKSWTRLGIDVGSLRGREQLTLLPTISREQIQSEPEAFLASTGNRQEWCSSKTSGSTGRPLVTWFDPPCWRRIKYVFKARRLLASGWKLGQRITIVEAIAPDATAPHAAEQSVPGERWLGARQYLSVFEPAEQHLAAYRAFRPHYLYAYPSYLAVLAECWDEASRRAVPLKAIFTSAEWSHPMLRRRLQSAFGAPVLDVYGSTECKEIAWQCPSGPGYHVNMESVVVELLGPDGREVPLGEIGDVVVTTLTNRAMPLIRYVTGDRARRLDGRCPCGRGLERLEGIEGRMSEVLHLPGGAVMSPYELTTLIETQPGVLQYQITHHSPDALQVVVVLAVNAKATSPAAIQDALTQHLGNRVRIAVSAVTSLPSQPSGKRPSVRIEFPAPDATS